MFNASETLEESPALEVGTAETILDSAAFLFRRQGYHGTSMRQIARYAGVTPAAIYNHYPSKEDLFVAVLRGRLPHRALAEALASASGDTPHDLLRDGVRRMQEALDGRLEDLRLGFVELLEFDGRHLADVVPELLAPALAFVERLRASHPSLRAWPAALTLRLVGSTLASHLLSGVALTNVDGFLPDRLDDERLARFLAAGLLGATPDDPS